MNREETIDALLLLLDSSSDSSSEDLNSTTSSSSSWSSMEDDETESNSLFLTKVKNYPEFIEERSPILWTPEENDVHKSLNKSVPSSHLRILQKKETKDLE